MARLPNGNLLLMVRVAEALKESQSGDSIRAVRWSDKGYYLDPYPLKSVDAADPRKFRLLGFGHINVFALTSLSWILPVELTSDGLEVVEVHYDKIVEPRTTYQEYGVEDARLTKVGDRYYMTTCSVSSERHSTTLYESLDGLNYELKGIIFDHQNKDVLLFPRKIGGLYYALTRPLGDLYFATPPGSEQLPGPAINLAQSPDLLHWKPVDHPFIRPSKGTSMSMKLGGGSQPLETDRGWLVLFHGAEWREVVGVYRTFWALLDREQPWKILHLEEEPLLEADPQLTADMESQMYVRDVVFTTGIEEQEDRFILASGEADLCCRITHLSKDFVCHGN
jgi:predicted GH43/DUF377 family glycosyl hydrolase